MFRPDTGTASAKDRASVFKADRLESILTGSGDGYTLGMKTAVSIPDAVFEKAERLARRSRRSRSELFTAALSEYVARHAPDEVTDSLDRVCADVGDQAEPFVAAAARRVLERSEW
jgi:predicted transcriptional regulator